MLQSVMAISYKIQKSVNIIEIIQQSTLSIAKSLDKILSITGLAFCCSCPDDIYECDWNQI